MKNMYKISLAYLVFGLTTGLFYHEAAYWTHFEGESVLSRVHPHALALGVAVFLLMPLLMQVFQIHKQKSFRWFVGVYNLGLVMTLGFMTARGATQLFQVAVPSFRDHMMGGLAGIGHVIFTVGIGFLFHALMKSCDAKKDAQ